MSKLMKYVLVCAALAVLCGTAQATNLLLNPSFEINGGYGGASADSWTNTGRTGVETWAWHTGEWGMAVYSWGDLEAGTGEFYQDVAVIPGTSYDYTVWATRDAGVMTGTIVMKIVWYDGATPLSETFRDITTEIGVEEWPNPNWKNVFLTGVAPTDSDMARIGISTMVVTRALKFDDASFVPEPATMALLGLGSLFLVRRRK